MSPKLRAALATLITFAALLGVTTSARAVGARIDVQIVDRDSGETLTPILHDGAWWIAGRPGARYAVLLNNAGAGRRLGVVSVDGINAITGDVADWKQTGYVIADRETTEVDGWRKNPDEVAAFTFTALADSYAAQTGRPADIGVIGVAVFDEKRPRPIVRRLVEHRNAAEEASGGASLTEPSAVLPSSPSPKSRSSSPPIAEADRAVDDAARLGTGHGAIEKSSIRFVDFERARPQPDEIVTIHYDRRERLIAMGILAARPQPARAFPADDPVPHFVPDPPPR